MANLFPDEMVNVTDLRVERLGSQGDFGAETGARTVIVQNQRAIVARAQELVKGLEGAEHQLAAEIFLPPTAPTILRGDRVTWSDFSGAVSEEEVLEVEPWSMGGDLFGIRLRAGHSGATVS